MWLLMLRGSYTKKVYKLGTSFDYTFYGLKSSGLWFATKDKGEETAKLVGHKDMKFLCVDSTPTQ